MRVSHIKKVGILSAVIAIEKDTENGDVVEKDHAQSVAQLISAICQRIKSLKGRS